jgi:hypothetical protein
MNKLSMAAAITALALAPAIGWACDYETSASAGPAEQLGLAQPPAASKAPAPAVAKVAAPKVAKQALVREKVAVQQVERTVAARN